MIQIRPAVKADLPALAALHRSAMGDHGPDPAQTIAHLLRHGLVLCAADGQTLVGLATGQVAADEAEIHAVAVQTTARQRGIGRRLLDALETACVNAGAQTCFLEVRAANVAARALYGHAGYTQCGQRDAYYPDGEDAIVMRRDLVEQPCGD